MAAERTKIAAERAAWEAERAALVSAAEAAACESEAASARAAAAFGDQRVSPTLRVACERLSGAAAARRPARRWR